ncbi:hypothetical protein ACH4TX_03575 [Streptomyces sp. NPDC021098]|uniref:hypothetical protein n=1 Tax=unclassified Streptomyces TaxID=2593676 RepID=UPI0037B95BCA
MSNTLTHGAFRTGRLWAGAGVLSLVLFGSLTLAGVGSLEFDERCGHGMVTGPGRLLDVRRQAFPPAVICEYEGGEVSAGGTGVLGAVVWCALVGLVLCVVLALLAECVELPAGTGLQISRTERLRRTGTAFFVTGSFFALVYGLAAWPLLTGPSSACSAGGEWGSYPPKTLDYTLFPPQATCMFHSGTTSRLNAGWVASLTVMLAVPALISAAGLALAWRRGRREAHAARAAGSPSEASAG